MSTCSRGESEPVLMGAGPSVPSPTAVCEIGTGPRGKLLPLPGSPSASPSRRDSTRPSLVNVGAASPLAAARVLGGESISRPNQAALLVLKFLARHPDHLENDRVLDLPEELVVQIESLLPVVDKQNSLELTEELLENKALWEVVKEASPYLVEHMDHLATLAESSRKEDVMYNDTKPWPADWESKYAQLEIVCGTGAFGQVVQCRALRDEKLYACKIIR